MATDVPAGVWSRAQGCLRGQFRLDTVQYCRRVAGVPTHLTAQKSFNVVISRAGDQVEVFIDDAVELRTQLQAVMGERV